MSREDKVLCQCCGKMMVPRSVLSNGLFISGGAWIGRRKPVSSFCPFCLSEEWHGIKPSLRESGWYTSTVAIAVFAIALVSFIPLVFIVGLFGELLGTTDFVDGVVAFLLAISLGVILYKRLT